MVLNGSYRQLALTPDPLEQQWRRFHHDHPEVLQQLITLARQWKAAGHERIGVATLFEVLRWSRGMDGIRDDAGFKLNNSFRALYARHIMAICPDLDGFFEVRVQRSAEVDA